MIARTVMGGPGQFNVHRVRPMSGHHAQSKKFEIGHAPCGSTQNYAFSPFFGCAIWHEWIAPSYPNLSSDVRWPFHSRNRLVSESVLRLSIANTVLEISAPECRIDDYFAIFGLRNLARMNWTPFPCETRCFGMWFLHMKSPSFWIRSYCATS